MTKFGWCCAPVGAQILHAKCPGALRASDGTAVRWCACECHERKN